VLLYKMKKLRIQAGPDRETAMNDNRDAGAGAPLLAETNPNEQAGGCPTLRSALRVKLAPRIAPAIHLRLTDVGGGDGEQRNGAAAAKIPSGGQIDFYNMPRVAIE
jgi:hypothetical protein